MKKINWWKVASVAMMAASAILSFGHDLIEEQRSEEEMQDMVREEVQRQLQKRTCKREKYSLPYGRGIQTDKQRGLIFMYDHDYYAKMDKAMVRVLKAVARSVGYGFTGLYHYLKKQPTRLYEYIRYQIQLERDDQRETEIRFENLKQHGHI